MTDSELLNLCRGWPPGRRMFHGTQVKRLYKLAGREPPAQVVLEAHKNVNGQLTPPSWMAI